MYASVITGDTTTLDSRTLAATLEPRLAEMCEGRLGAVQWFKADWQRGGAATGWAIWRGDGGEERGAVVKLPVGPRELTWTRRLQEEDGSDPVIPRLYASGAEIGSYDLAWMVLERFEHGPLGLQWHDDHILRIAQAAARFQARASRYPIDRPPVIEDWPGMLKDAAESVRKNHVAHRGRWGSALKTLRGRLDRWVADWQARPIADWLHGDLHIANAMSRQGINEGAVCLIDLAEVRAGHWVEDAVYLERQCWARPERMDRHKPLKAMADARRREGLLVDPDYPRIAMIRRSLLAATAPRFIRSEGHPRHLEACLEWLEKGLEVVK